MNAGRIRFPCARLSTSLQEVDTPANRSQIAKALHRHSTENFRLKHSNNQNETRHKIPAQTWTFLKRLTLARRCCGLTPDDETSAPRERRRAPANRRPFTPPQKPTPNARPPRLETRLANATTPVDPTRPSRALFSLLHAEP